MSKTTRHYHRSHSRRNVWKEKWANHSIISLEWRNLHEMSLKDYALPDHLMSKYFELFNGFHTSRNLGIFNMHPRDAKLKLAEGITTMLHNSQDAETAKEEFLRCFPKKVFLWISEKCFLGTLLFLKYIVWNLKTNGRSLSAYCSRRVKWAKKIESIEKPKLK